ncbi:uncharacterized protein LOC111321698 isoform X1 [Stylophora pistillata]|uniref:uncharacterized protein LOC111321698 isoform X1 n=1 Tax=Stylophora pistillata TaxID=50429 RepID=UPI000C03A5EC|nr:uncharacterized protein LOC111321698 isoform X1 [Stylophora pistillata]
MAEKEAPGADREAEANEFFRRVVTPMIDNLSEFGLSHLTLEHRMKDEAKNIVVHGCPNVPEEVSTIQEVQEAVTKARKGKKVLRVVGSKHSVNAAIYDENDITLKLKGDLRKVEILRTEEENGKKWLYCRIGGGCYLGKDPTDPLSAVHQVAAQGYGFPELGGIIQQTIGGFIMTGSAGGSLKHSFSDTIREIEFVDGNAQVQKAKPETDLWYAVGVSMGLFGVITRVTFRLPPMKFIKGSESNHKFVDSMLGPDMKGQSKLKQSLEENEYMRVNWFPQKDLNRVQEWVGQQSFKNQDLIPYKPILSCPLAAGMAAVVLSKTNCILQKEDPTEKEYSFISMMLRLFVPLCKPTEFYDHWYHALPMDNEINVEFIIRVKFTEIWVPIDQCQTVMEKLQELFSENRKAANNFATEIYGAKRSPFWLSMSYQEDMVRVDPYWWGCKKCDPRKFFSYFWDILLDIPRARLHWGKYLPKPGQKCGNTTFNADYLKSVYPKMNDWLKLREQHDPDQVFMTEYWRGILEIKPKTQ